MAPAIFNHVGHRELWGWLAAHPDKDKEDWPGWKSRGGKYDNAICDCFACEADIEYKRTYTTPDSGVPCEYCPLCQRYSNKGCLDGLYEDWALADSLEEKSEMALLIRNLPVRDIPGMIVECDCKE